MLHIIKCYNLILKIGYRIIMIPTRYIYMSKHYNYYLNSFSIIKNH